MVDPGVVAEVLKSLEGRKFEYVQSPTPNPIPAKLIVGKCQNIE